MPTDEIEKLIAALADIRTACSRVGWDRSATEAAKYAEERAVEAMEAAGYDAYAGGVYRRSGERR